MKKLSKYPLYAFAASLILIFSSCSNEEEGKGIEIGSVDIFDNFFGYNYEPEMMTETLTFDFNDDAKQYFPNGLEFELVEQKVGDSIRSAVEHMQLYKDSVLCENNILSIHTNETEVTIGILYTKDALDGVADGKHIYYLREKGNSGIVIDDIEIGSGFLIKKHTIANPLAKGLLLGFITLAVILVVWILLAHFVINPPLKFSKVIINYGNGDMQIRTNGAYKLVCTNKPIKVSFMKKLFVGNIAVVVNEFWTKPLTIQCGSRRRLRFTNRAAYNIDPIAPNRKEVLTIKNSEGKEVKIQTT